MPAPETDMDRVMVTLAELRGHLLGAVASIDRLLWFMNSERPVLFDGDAEEEHVLMEPE